MCHRFKGNSFSPFFSVTMISAFKQVQKSARESGLTFKEYCKYPFCYFARLLVIYTFVLSILFPLGCFSFNYCHYPLLFSDAALMISLKIQSRIIKASTQKQTRQKQKLNNIPLLIIIHCFAVVRGRDPNAVAVLLEDSAAVTGLLLASGCLGLASYTGNMIYDAIGSISIGGKNTVTLRTPVALHDPPCCRKSS